MSPTRRFYAALCLGAALTAVCTNETVDQVSTTTERHEFLSSFDRLITKMESTKNRIAKVLNETRLNDIKSYHDILIGKGYQYTLDIGYHKLYNKQLSWFDAMQYCRMDDAHLAIIDSAAESLVISKLVKEKLPVAVSVEKSIAYIGYHDYCANGWIDVFFKPLDNNNNNNNNNYIQWKESTGPLDSAEAKCAVIDAEGYLHSSSCTLNRAFICETKLPY